MRAHRRVVILIAAVALATGAGLLLLLSGPLRGAQDAPAASPAGASAGKTQLARRVGSEPPVARKVAELEAPAPQDHSSLEDRQPVAGRPIKAPSFSGKPIEPILPVLDEVRRELHPHVLRCAAESRDQEEPPADPFHLRLELFIEKGEARVDFERVERQGEREFPLFGDCLAATLPAQRFRLEATPPADYAREGVFNLPWVVKLSLED